LNLLPVLWRREFWPIPAIPAISGDPGDLLRALGSF
jgi:hypothetical protein